MGRVTPEESAFPHRTAAYNLSIDAGWSDPALDHEAVAWARDAWDAMRPFATGGVYILKIILGLQNLNNFIHNFINFSSGYPASTVSNNVGISSKETIRPNI